jgi:membrane protein YqaA with SNARE-associated domain
MQEGFLHGDSECPAIAIDGAMSNELDLERYDAWGRGLSRIWVGALWGLAEATVFFLVPDIIITASALFSPRRSFAQMMAVLIGALLGGALLYTAADKYPDEARNAVLSVPFIKTRMLEKSERQLQDHGLWALCIGAFAGIPYKTYALAAPRHAPFEAFMAVSVPARLSRFLVSWGVASLLGIGFRKQMEAAPVVALGLLFICWVGFYTYYWSVI